MTSPGIRICYENLTNESNSLVASSTSGNLVASNMTNDLKGEVWRSASKVLSTITITWSAARNVNMVGLIFTNLTATATMRVRGYTNVGDSTPNFDTGTNNACTYAPLGALNWGSFPLGVNAFRFGGVSHGRSYFPTANVAKLIIDITDNDNVNNYIEVARLLTGIYWEPECNPEYGAEFIYKFYQNHEETQSGDLRTERRPRRRGINFNLAWLQSQQDLYAMNEIFLAAGMDTPIWISLFPENADPLLEQRCQMYVKLDGDHSMSHPKYGIFAAPLRLLEI